MPGTPATSPRVGAPRFANTDAADFSTDVNGVVDAFDAAVALKPTLVTSLPGSPFDAQIIDYVADATNGVVWRFRYRSASSSAYKWEFVGGPNLWAYDVASRTGTSSGTPNTSLAPNTADALTAPFAGDYEVQAEATHYSPNVATSMGVNVALTSTPTVPLAPATTLGAYLTAVSGGYGSVTAFSRINALAASSVLTPVVYFTAASVSYTVVSVSLLIRPVRVG